MWGFNLCFLPYFIILYIKTKLQVLILMPSMVYTGECTIHWCISPILGVLHMREGSNSELIQHSESTMWQQAPWDACALSHYQAVSNCNIILLQYFSLYPVQLNLESAPMGNAGSTLAWANLRCTHWRVAVCHLQLCVIVQIMAQSADDDQSHTKLVLGLICRDQFRFREGAKIGAFSSVCIPVNAGNLSAIHKNPYKAFVNTIKVICVKFDSLRYEVELETKEKLCQSHLFHRKLL